MKEPRITIDGIVLTNGQAMTVRVALSSFLFDLRDRTSLGTDEHGLAMTAAYKARLVEIFKLINED